MTTVLNIFTMLDLRCRFATGSAWRLSQVMLVALCLSALAPQTRAAEPEVAEQGNDDRVFLLSDDGWISDIGVLLYADDDADGFFSGLSLSIDADTAFVSNEVYATIDIESASSLGGNSFTRLYTTLPFYLYGQSISDEYRVEIDLLNNYYADFFNLSVTLIDARSHRILDQVGAFEFRNLSELPLESVDFDSAFIPVIDRPLAIANDDIVAVEYVGMSGPLVLVVLLLSLTLRKAQTAMQTRADKSIEL